MAHSYRTLLAVASTLALVAGCGTVSAASRSAGRGIPASPANEQIKLAETGSSLLFPLFDNWAKAYHQQFGNVTITSASTGSAAGITDAASGSADIGASDAFLSSGNLVQSPRLLNIPLVISAQQINYNLPRVPQSEHVKLNADLLAQMYDGTITNWDDSRIKQLNPGISLPNLPVRPLHRFQGPASAGSVTKGTGDTFLFTSYLSTNENWNAQIGYGTTIAWPKAPGALAELNGNGGMVHGCQVTPGCVAYVGISYLTMATDDHLGTAELRNHSGAYVLPNPGNITDAVSSFVAATPDSETISMVNGPAPDGYPIVNFEYAIVADRQPSAVKARDIKAFLHWAITKGNASQFLGPPLLFEPLPAPVVALADDQIARIR